MPRPAAQARGGCQELPSGLLIRQRGGLEAADHALQHGAVLRQVSGGTCGVQGVQPVVPAGRRAEPATHRVGGKHRSATAGQAQLAEGRHRAAASELTPASEPSPTGRQAGRQAGRRSPPVVAHGERRVDCALRLPLLGQSVAEHVLLVDLLGIKQGGHLQGQTGRNASTCVYERRV